MTAQITEEPNPAYKLPGYHLRISGAISLIFDEKGEKKDEMLRKVG